jgi:hypothetical protein
VVGASIPVAVGGADATPCFDGGRANEAKPWPEVAPGEAALAPRSSRGVRLQPTPGGRFE